MNLKLGILCTFFLLSARVEAATDIFLKLGDINGESQRKGHENEIELLSWSWGLHSAGATTGGAGAGRVVFQDLTFTKLADSSSPLLMLSTANGKHHPQAVLTLERPGERPFMYYRVTLEDVVVTSVSTSVSTVDNRPTEIISLNFTKVKIEYIPQRADGSAGTPVVFTWNLLTNTP